MPAGVPIQCTFQPRAVSSLAIARPGKMWPPVPAAMMRMVRGALTAISPA